MNWDIILTSSVIVSLLTGITLVVTTFKERQEDGKPISSWPFWLSVISAIILLITAYNGQRDSNKKDALNDSLVQVYKNLDRKNDSLNYKSSELVTVYRSLNNKNDTLLNLQKNIIDSNNTFRRLQDKIIVAGEKNNLANQTISDLQNELYNQITGKQSFPLLTAEITSLPKYAFDFLSDSPRLAVNLKNLGKYPVTNIEVSYIIIKYNFEGSYSLPETFVLSPGETLEIKSFNLEDLGVEHAIGMTIAFTVRWKFAYIFQVHLQVPFPEPDVPVGYMFLSDYRFNNQSYGNSTEFSKAVLKTLH